VCWLVGILPDGTIRALPQHMQRHQRLPSGDQVHHSAFEIPRGLWDPELGGDAHALVRKEFVLTAVCAASILSALQVTVRRGDLAVRIGIPSTSARTFFADRERDGDRRKPILHLRPAHYRRLASGRLTTVGDHLAGNRFLSGAGTVMISAPASIRRRSNYAAPNWTGQEAFEAQAQDGVPIGEAAREIAEDMWWHPTERARFVRGEPARPWRKDRLPLAAPPGSP
jgi:hypothetical protein